MHLRNPHSKWHLVLLEYDLFLQLFHRLITSEPNKQVQYILSSFISTSQIGGKQVNVLRTMLTAPISSSAPRFLQQHLGLVLDSWTQICN